MNTIKIIFTTILFAAFTIVQAQSAKVTKVWTEHNVTENGQKGMRIHTNFSVSGMQNKTGRCNAWFYYGNDTQLFAASHSQNVAPNGSLFIHKSFTPKYDNTNFTDFKLFLPYKELNDILSNKTELLFLIGIDDHNGSSIADSEYIYFSFSPDKTSPENNIKRKPRQMSDNAIAYAKEHGMQYIKNEVYNPNNNASNNTVIVEAKGSVSEVQLTNSEMQLYNLIMEYRRQKGLSSIPISKSLTYVAQTHAKDLQDNFKRGSMCNMHSWSDKGNWQQCCYTDDHAQAQCLWDKPRELTPYKGNGFEIAYWQSSMATPQSALNGWKQSKGHNDTMINQGIWANYDWNAIGIGMHGNYAVVWFGKEEDPVK